VHILSFIHSFFLSFFLSPLFLTALFTVLRADVNFISWRPFSLQMHVVRSTELKHC